tara:strand:- start:797 stop:1036 length:240 start_codon:yes stop_codon:yes gene_type:complete
MSTFTLKELLASVPDAKAHYPESMVRQGLFTPPPRVDASNRRHYLPAHVDQLAAYVLRLQRRRARRDARRGFRSEGVTA